MKVASWFPPAIVTTLNGERYVVPSWTLLAAGVTLEQIDWEKLPEPSGKSLTVIASKDVVGSRGGHYHLEKWSDGKITCTCSGFKFRGKCKHTKELA